MQKEKVFFAHNELDYEEVMLLKGILLEKFGLVEKSIAFVKPLQVYDFVLSTDAILPEESAQILVSTIIQKNN